MIASTSCASMYSGSFLGCAELSDAFGCAPRGRRLRATAWGCHGAAPVQEALRAILANRGFLGQFKEGAQLRATVAGARNVGDFLARVQGTCRSLLGTRAKRPRFTPWQRGSRYSPRSRRSSASSSAARASAAPARASSSSWDRRYLSVIGSKNRSIPSSQHTYSPNASL